MADQNVSLVQGLYAAFGRGDVDSIAGQVLPDVIWGVVGERRDFPTFGVFQGPDGVKDFFRAVGQNLDVTEFDTTEFHAAGDKVLVLGRYVMTVKKTGRQVKTDLVHVFTIRDGKVAAFREFNDTASVVEAYRG